MARIRTEVLWLAMFAIATGAGTVLAVDPSRLTLSHSAVGVGALWLSRPGRRAAPRAAVIMLVTAGVARAAGVGWPIAGAIVVSTMAGAGFAAAARHRWAAGCRLDGLADVVSLALVAAGAGVVAGLAAAPAMAWPAADGWPFVILVGVRAALGTLLALGVAAAWVALPPPPGARLIVRLAAEAIATGAVLAALLIEEHSLPMLFVAVPLTLWITARGPLLRILSHAAVAGATIVVFTAWGFGHLARQGFYIGAIGAEFYVLVLTTTGTALAVLRLQAESAAFRAASADDGLRAALSANPAALVGVRVDDGTATITGSNNAAQALLGISGEGLKGASLLRLLQSHDHRLLVAGLTEVAAGTAEAWAGHVSLRSEAGPVKRLEVTARRWQDAYPGRLLLNLSDITRAWESRERLSWAALHDSDTGLPNRAMLTQHIVTAIYASLATGRHTAAVVIDVDGWRRAQHQIGWDDGGRFLSALGARLQDAARPQDLVGLTADARFVVCCPDVADLDHATELASHLRRAIAEPIVIADQVVHLQARAGVAVCEDLSAPDELLSRAQLASQRLSPDAHPGVSAWTSDLAEAAARDRDLRHDLNQAAERGQLRLHYQPVIDIASGATAAVEALVRWDHPQHGLLAPGNWIGIAETHGAIVEIGRWVLREACAQVAALRAEGHALTIQVNVSARQLRDADIGAQVIEALTAAGAHPTWLVLEVTETHLLHVDDALIETLERLRRTGVRIAVDDFGTGFSTLQAVAQMPVDELKIDRSFIQGLATAPRSAAVVSGVIGIAQGMGATVVAEGVEHPAQAQTLLEKGCALAQGFLWSPPLPQDALRRFLADRAPTSPAPLSARPVAAAAVAR
ncbi:EAL domain-containing protein [Isoptericola sp. b441]|uniref:EAL domain-containing protein n=1 Tax=Actinotalea lenta TaxID=3064654 RepID=A0ABT9DBS1_9CELL|nr:EAL domain-containing protein [Isoptericola sp. b441]MDO8108330.1 EAL domain-containing protein [Isoptericola sp. b441]